MKRNERKGREPILPRLLSDLPRNEPLPWRVARRGRRYRGDVIIADSWREGLGEMERDITFRIVFLTRAQKVSPPADPRVALFLPGQVTPRFEKAAGEYRALKEEGAAYEVAPPADREVKERQLLEELFSAESQLYASGRILAQGPLSLDLSYVFSLPDNSRRFDLVATSLLAAVQDVPLWSRVLDYARLLDEKLGPAASPEEVAARERQLLSRLRELRSALPGLRSALYALSTGLGRYPAATDLKAMERLSPLSGSRNAADFGARVRKHFASARELEEALSLCRNLQALSPLIPEILAVKAYLDAVELPETESQMAVDRLSILEQMDPGALLSAPHLWSGLKDRFDWFKGRFRTLYSSYHRRYHEEVVSLVSQLERLELRVRALGYLNSIAELGTPVALELVDEYERLRKVMGPCPLWENEVPLEGEAVCSSCGLRLTSPLPRREVEDFLHRLERALGQQQRRLSRKAVRQILAQSHQPRIEQFIKVVQTSDLSSLANILDDELVSFLRQLLAGR